MLLLLHHHCFHWNKRNGVHIFVPPSKYPPDVTPENFCGSLSAFQQRKKQVLCLLIQSKSFAPFYLGLALRCQTTYTHLIRESENTEGCRGALEIFYSNALAQKRIIWDRSAVVVFHRIPLGRVWLCLLCTLPSGIYTC